MAIPQTFAKRDPSAAIGAIATAAATTVGLLLLFSGLYILVVMTLVLPRFDRFKDIGKAELARHQAEAKQITQGFLLVSPLLAGGYSGAVMASPVRPTELQPLNQVDWSLLLFAITAILSVPFAIFAYVRQRALRLGWPLPWAIFVLFFGPLGWVAYRVHRRWPPVAKCEQCAGSVPQHLGECLVCGEKFLPPAPVGTEVFA